MTKSAKPLPLRQANGGEWEVKDASGNWIKCETEEDAKILSNAPIVREASYKTTFPNKTLAARLEKTAEKMEQYNMLSTSRLFRKRAKLARGI